MTTTHAPTLTTAERADLITDSGLDFHEQLDVAYRIIAEVRDSFGPNPASERLSHVMDDLRRVYDVRRIKA